MEAVRLGDVTDVRLKRSNAVEKDTQTLNLGEGETEELSMLIEKLLALDKVDLVPHTWNVLTK